MFLSFIHIDDQYTILISKLRQTEQEFQDTKMKYSDLGQRNKELEGDY